jgi:hypothetical protein
MALRFSTKLSEKAKAIPAEIEGTSSAEVVTVIKPLFLGAFSCVFDRQACAWLPWRGQCLNLGTDDPLGDNLKQQDENRRS